MGEKFRYKLVHNIIEKFEVKSLSKWKLKNKKITDINFICNEFRKVDEPLII